VAFTQAILFVNSVRDYHICIISS